MQGTILDRLIERDPNAAGSVQYRQPSFNQAKAAVARDLENLLNCKNFFTPFPEAFKELNRSVMAYGLPDFTAMNPRGLSEKSELLHAVERAIQFFEPRLKNVMVSLDDSDNDARRILFKISALLVMEPFVESVHFDTYFEVNRCKYSISG
jgi:type VI secretion system protein ImpF